MQIIVKSVELLCFLILTLLGALVVGIGMVLTFPGRIVRLVGEWIVYFAGKFE